MSDYCAWLKARPAPELWVKGDPGALVTGNVADFCASLPNQTELTVKGLHFLQETSGPQIGNAVADFVRNLRG